MTTNDNYNNNDNDNDGQNRKIMFIRNQINYSRKQEAAIDPICMAML